MNRPKIVGIGELVWDMLPDGKQLGGAPVNFAYWCNRLGAEGYPLSAVGDDTAGAEMISVLARTGLSLDYIQHNSMPTGQVNVMLSGDGIPQYDIVKGVAWDSIEADDKALALAAQADVVCWGSLAQRTNTSRQAIATIVDATRAKALRIFDINIRQNWYDTKIITTSLDKANILKLNEDELPLIASLLELEGSAAETIARLINTFSLKYVIYTAGADHSEIHSIDGLISSIPTPKVDVVDTVGAGDSFTAAFTTALLQNDPIAVCHRKAVDVAAKVCSIHGAIPDAL